MSTQESIDVVMRSGLAAADKTKLVNLLRLIDKPTAEMTHVELRMAREAAGLSIDQAAKLARLEPGVLGRWECGTDRPTSPVWFERLDAIYGVGRPREVNVLRCHVDDFHRHPGWWAVMEYPGIADGALVRFRLADGPVIEVVVVQVIPPGSLLDRRRALEIGDFIDWWVIVYRPAKAPLDERKVSV